MPVMWINASIIPCTSVELFLSIHTSHSILCKQDYISHLQNRKPVHSVLEPTHQRLASCYLTKKNWWIETLTTWRSPIPLSTSDWNMTACFLKSRLCSNCKLFIECIVLVILFVRAPWWSRTIPGYTSAQSLFYIADNEIFPRSKSRRVIVWRTCHPIDQSERFLSISANQMTSISAGN